MVKFKYGMYGFFLNFNTSLVQSVKYSVHFYWCTWELVPTPKHRIPIGTRPLFACSQMASIENGFTNRSIPKQLTGKRIWGQYGDILYLLTELIIPIFICIYIGRYVLVLSVSLIISDAWIVCIIYLANQTFT